jgi:hypothetical protein
MSRSGNNRTRIEKIADVLRDLDSPEQAVAVMSESLREYSASMTPLQALKFARMVRDSAKQRSDEISGALVASVNGEAGKYPGFTVVDVAGRASVDTVSLADQFPEAYAATVSWGAPYKTVRLTAAQPGEGE